MNIRKLAATAITAATLVGATALTGGVATADARVAAASSCSYNTLTALESVKIRTTTKLDATAVGLLPKGKSGRGCDSTGTGQSGQSYNLCGKKDNSWVLLSYAGHEGWVPTTCIKQWR
ncbi:hypothetical protein FGW37_25310 [Streptomyces rectiverticillatus]|uniref:hypothetical protein n=1 Tax=Streptomyces rectiverticillatus TaxID=173860 RepID=UPI0015C38747|nr:hypothetical protein [Streptomyces rectiverticillatus]QLE74470.1 hypothetical protein FGW37_25310 [Streptomyces rectiverticillatus]